MTRTLKSLALTIVGVAVCAIGSPAPAAAGAAATLHVNGAVTSNCEVTAGNPASISFTYDTIENTGTKGTTNYTYACTNGASVSVTPTDLYSPNGPGNSWYAKGGTQYLAFNLFNDQACSSDILAPGQAESLGTGTGSSQTYYICGTPVMPPGGQYELKAGSYTDTVTFTFDFGP